MLINPYSLLALKPGVEGVEEVVEVEVEEVKEVEEGCIGLQRMHRITGVTGITRTEAGTTRNYTTIEDCGESGEAESGAEVRAASDAESRQR